MTSTLTNSLRPRMIKIHKTGEAGDMAALDMGDPQRPVDIIFVHANGFNAQTYVSILAPLAKDFRILAIDQRGHGRSTLIANPQARRSWGDMRDDLVALLDVLGAEPGARPVVLAGHSMGGTVSLLASRLRPDRVKGLVMFDPVIMPWAVSLMANLPWADHKVWKAAPIAQGALRRKSVFDDRASVVAAYKGRGAFKTWPEEVLADYVAGGFKDRADGKLELACSPAWEASNFTAMANDPWTAAARASCPVQVFRAEIASTCRIGEASAFCRRNRRGLISVTEVAGTTHFLPMERPALVRQALAEAMA
jgi:pimeloyl-ACP methyl ester carboxylesterase